MIVIPINTTEKSYLILVIEPANLERMKQADPITLQSKINGGLLDIQHRSNYELIVAYEEDSAELQSMVRDSDTMGLLNYVTRGYKFQKGLDGMIIGEGGQWHDIKGAKL